MRTEGHPAVSGEVTGSDIVRRFTAALAARDPAALQSLFGSKLDFRGLRRMPGRTPAGTQIKIVHTPCGGRSWR
jgi:hypothetical protein